MNPAISLGTPLVANWLRHGQEMCTICATQKYIPSRDAKMTEDEWITAREDGRKVKFIYQELPEDRAFISAQIAGNKVVYSILLTKTRNPLRREDVEGHFESELLKK